MDRRDFLAVGAASGFAGAIPVSAMQASPATLLMINPGLDRSRAQHILRQAGFDAVLVGRSENVFYATGNRPLMSRLGIADSSFAIIPADSSAPVIYVLPQFSYYYSVVDAGLAQGVELHLVTGPDAGGNAPAFYYTSPDKALIPARERQRRERTDAVSPYFATTAAAVASILGKLGANGGRIGYDSLEAQQLLKIAAPSAQGANAVDTVKAMRLIKSAFEIQLMRAASAANVAAARKTAENLRNLGTIRNVRNYFNGEVSRLGNSPGFMVVHGVVDEAYDETFTQGTSVLIDCVSTLHGYHGDYGRTIFIGEPRQPMAAKVRAMGVAWDELRQQLKPGMRFSEIRAAGANILRKLGYNINVPFNPHCVGLAHTEQPMADNAGVAIDTLLAPGMIISVDCPLMEASTAGTAHLEDLTLITTEGQAPIHDTGNKVIIV